MPDPTVKQMSLLRALQATDGYSASVLDECTAKECVSSGWIVAEGAAGYGLTVDGAVRARPLQARRLSGVFDWAKRQREMWRRSLMGLRSGVLGTSEVRHGKRVDTTAEEIAERKRGIAELDTLIAREDDDEPSRPLG